MAYTTGTGGFYTINTTNGAPLIVNITGATAYSDAARTASVTFPATITAATTYYFQDAPLVTIVAYDAYGIQVVNTTAQFHGNEGSVVTPSRTFDQDVSRVSLHGANPAQAGFLAWAFDPDSASATYTMTPAGTIAGTRIQAPSVPITNIHTILTTAGSGLTSGQCFAAIYQGNALLGVTGDQQASGFVGSARIVTMALSAPVTPIQPSGPLDVVFWYNGTTGPTWATGANPVGINGLSTTTAIRHFTADASITTTGPATLGAKTALNKSIWVALS